MKIARIGLIGSVGLLMALSSCHKPVSKDVSIHTVEKHDSIIFKETLRDVPVYIPGDSVLFYVQLPCKNNDSTKVNPFHYQSRSKRAKLNLNIDSTGVLSGVCACEEEKFIIQAKDTFINHLQSELTALKEQQTIVVKEYPKSFWWLLSWAVVSALYIIYKIISFIKSFIP